MSTYNFLDKTGLTYFFNKIKGMFAPKKQGAEYIVGTQAASTAKWLGTTEDSALFDGKVILYYLPQAGVSSTNVTLELTLSGGTTTGELPVYFNNGTTRMTTQFGRGSIIPLMFCTSRRNSSGTEITNSWIHLADYDTTNIYQLRKNGGTYISSTALYRYILCVTKSETTLLPLTTANNTTGTSKTLTTDSFNPFGEIFYYNSTTAVSANGSITASTLYRQMSVDTRYTFNTAKTLTSNKAAYLKCTPQSDGTVKLDTTTPLTQTLPSTADGKVYIYLGQTSSTYQLELSITHPIYEYKDGKIRQWTNAFIPTKTSDLTNDSNFVNSNSLATVATSGDYTDLSNKPTIGSDTLTIKVNGATVQTFSANQANGSVTANITVPTKTSDLTNDRGFTVNGVEDVKINGTSIISNYEANIVTQTAYDATTNKIATMADIGGGGGTTFLKIHVSDIEQSPEQGYDDCLIVSIDGDISPQNVLDLSVYGDYYVQLEIPNDIVEDLSSSEFTDLKIVRYDWDEQTQTTTTTVLQTFYTLDMKANGVEDLLRGSFWSSSKIYNAILRNTSSSRTRGLYVYGENTFVENTVTQGSENAVSSGAVYTAIQNAGGGSSDHIIEFPSSWSSVIDEYDQAGSPDYFSVDILANTYSGIGSDHEHYFVNADLYNAIDRIMQGDIAEVKLNLNNTTYGNDYYVSSAYVSANGSDELDVKFTDEAYVVSQDLGSLSISGKYITRSFPYYTISCSQADISYFYNNAEFTNNKVTSISSSSTNTQYPSALAVYNYVNSASGGDNEAQLYNFICSSVIPGDDNTNDTFVIDVDTDIRPNTFVYDSTATYTNVKLGFATTLFEQCYGTDRINVRLVKNNTTLKEFSVYGKQANINIDYMDKYGTWEYGNILFNATFDCSNSEVNINGQDLLYYDDVRIPVKDATEAAEYALGVALGKQDKLATQTAYTSKGTSTKVPQITTNSLGQVTGITEVAITQPVTKYYTAWGNSLVFYVPLGHQALITCDFGVMILLWNQEDAHHTTTIVGSGFSISRDSTNKTKLTVTKTNSGSSTITALVF